MALPCDCHAKLGIVNNTGVVSEVLKWQQQTTATTHWQAVEKVTMNERFENVKYDLTTTFRGIFFYLCVDCRVSKSNGEITIGQVHPLLYLFIYIFPFIWCIYLEVKHHNHFILLVVDPQPTWLFKRKKTWAPIIFLSSCNKFHVIWGIIMKNVHYY